jgi:hypothetical protein
MGLAMSDEKKIIIDEDWKSQVQAEKAAATKSRPAAGAGEQTGKTEPVDVPMPPASFELTVTTLATEALVALGQVPHPATGKTHVHRHQAQYFIDTIEVLRTKTKGNLTADEQQMIDSLLHQLRMLFISVAAQPAGTSETGT